MAGAGCHYHVQGAEVEIDATARIGPGAVLAGRRIVVGAYAEIAAGVVLQVPGGLEIGPCAKISPGCRVTCWQFRAGPYLYMERDVEIGRGGCLSSAESVVMLGRGVFLGAEVVLNPDHAITIGDEVGIGARSGIWTHGAYLSVTQGFPAMFAPVTIGSRVWLPGLSQVLPGVTIGDDVVVGMMSLVNRDLPSGCLAGGVPARVLRERVFPRPTDLAVLAQQLGAAYEQRLVWLGFESTGAHTWTRLHAPGVDGRVGTVPPRVVVAAEGAQVKLCTDAHGVSVVFDLQTRICNIQADDAVAEDCRDFLRRRGIRFFTGRPFRALECPEVSRWRPPPEATAWT